MPNFDKTGPEGKGPQTGRKAGKCNPENDIDNNSFRRGTGRGCGRPRRCCQTGQGRFRNQNNE